MASLREGVKEDRGGREKRQSKREEWVDTVIPSPKLTRQKAGQEREASESTN